MASVTITDVAKHAQVSIKTVSRVLNDEPHVAENTRLKVEQAIQELDFVANLPARRLASGQSYTIGLVFQNASWHYIHDVQKGAMETALPLGYSMLLHPYDLTNIEDENGVVKLVSQKQVDGFIFTPPADNAKGLIAKLTKLGVPFVRLTPSDRESPLPYVAATDKQGAFDMTQYLISLGHKQIGFIFGQQEQRAAHDRFAGYKQALAEAQLPFDESYVADGDDHFDSGFQAATKLIRLDNRPTAIFCNNDEMAAGAIAAVFESKLSVPDDVSIAGFDNIPMARQIWPPLTTVEQPIFEIAEEATNKLIKILNKEEVQELHSNLPTKIIVRKSTRSPR